MILFLALANAVAGTLSEGTHHIFSGVSYGTWSSFESKGSEKSLPQSAKEHKYCRRHSIPAGSKTEWTYPYLSVSNVSASGVRNMFAPTTEIAIGVSLIGCMEQRIIDLIID